MIVKKEAFQVFRNACLNAAVKSVENSDSTTGCKIHIEAYIVKVLHVKKCS